MKNFCTLLLAVFLSASAQAAIDPKYCADECAMSYSGKKYKYCNFICRYGDVIYVAEKRWINTKDCKNLTSPKAKREGYMPICKKAVKLYLNYWR